MIERDHPGLPVFHLRVFNEHAEYDDDLKYDPNRVLQSGVITLNDLRKLGAIAIGVVAFRDLDAANTRRLTASPG